MIRRKGFLIKALALCLGFSAGLAFFLYRPKPAKQPKQQKQPKPAIPADWDMSLGYPPVFTDITRQAGIAFKHHNGLTGKYHYPEIMGGGIALLDYDGDGWLDIYFVNGNHLLKEPSPDLINRLYRNNRDGTFTDVTAAAGVGDAGFGQGCCAADYDNDGDPDLYLSNYGPNILYENQGDGTFKDVTRRAGLEDPLWGQSSSFLDYDNDGLLDLYVQNYLTYSTDLAYEAYIYIGNEKFPDYPAPSNFKGAQDHLYRNNGDGTFTDVTEKAGLTAPNGKGMGIACYDMDNDGWTDILVTNDGIENYLFHNNGDGTFTETGLVAGFAVDGLGIPEGSMGVDIGDYDGDGRLDVIVPCLRKQVYTLYKNHGDYFSDTAMQTGLTQTTSERTGFNANFLDYDNDGDLDLFFTTGDVRANELVAKDAAYPVRYGQTDLLLGNNGRGKFSDASAWAGSHFAAKHIGRGAVTGDLDNDGDLDLVISNLNGEAVVLRNDTAWCNWITLLLEPATGNKDAIGSVVTLKAGGKTQTTMVHGGVTYLSQIDRRVHFGLGKAGSIESITIVWPDRTRQVLEKIQVNQFLTVKQASPEKRDG